MQRSLLLVDGYSNGPLFVINKKRAPKNSGTILPGINRRESERRAQPGWACECECDIRAIWKEARRLTKLTVIVHSVDHIVPLQNPIVCGLHVPWNLEVRTLVDNVRKGNRYWPDMPFEQIELF